jgi:hypothetical protein
LLRAGQKAGEALKNAINDPALSSSAKKRFVRNSFSAELAERAIMHKFSSSRFHEW